MKLTFKLGLGAIVFATCLLSPFASKAADVPVAGLIVSPPIKEQEIMPGNAVTNIIRVSNPNKSADLAVSVETQDFTAQGEDGQQGFIDPNTNTSTFSMGKWILIQKEFVLKADETKEISYTINVPANAEAGGHYGVIFFTPSIVNGNSALNGSGVMTVPKVGSLVLVNIPGDIKYDGKIVEFLAGKKLYINSNNTVDFLTRFQNLGTTHVKPQGDIVIKNTLGKVVGTLKVNDKMGNVLPDSIRKFENSWTKNHGIGLYKATVTLASGNGSTVSAVISFWILPWKEIIIGIVALIILLFIFSHISWRKPNNQGPANVPINQGPDNVQQIS